jgi:sugar lactone lactonase YvrE
MSSSTPQHTITAQPIVKIENFLGEGPLWHPIHQMLYWVDIEKMEVHGLEPHTNRHRVWETRKKVGAVVAAANGNLILALQGEIAELDPANGKIKSLVKLEADLPENRCNDGKCDAAGRFWIGTMHVDCKPGTGSLYCVDTHLQVTKVLTGLTIANGMGWSPDGDYMYFIDSADCQVKRFKFSSEKVSLEQEKIILRFEKERGLPDGMCVDSEGMLWIGFWGGSCVGRYDPATGKHLGDIRVTAPHVTSCCFGGPDLQTLFITTAREGLTPQQLKEFPLSGSLFSCDTAIKGSEVHLFGLKG